MRYAGVFNRDGGTFRTIDIDAFAATAARILTDAGHALEPHIVSGKELEAELKRAAASGADALLVGGGDGTVSAAAGAAFQSGIALAVLPAGTINFFARALHMPLALEDALHAIATGEVREVDIATANGRPFVHQYSVGVHVRLVRIRESLEYHSRYGKMLANVRAFFATVARPLPRFDVEVSTTGGTTTHRSSAVVVTNNPLPDRVVGPTGNLDQGTLGLYVAEPLTHAAALRLATAIVFGRWRESDLVFDREVQRAALAFPAREINAQATIDGELIPLAPRVELVSHPAGLKVVVPAAAKPAAG